MNVVLNTVESSAVLGIVTGQLIDSASLSELAKKAIRDWRRGITPGTAQGDAFTERLNVAIGNFIDERTNRMMHVRGSMRVKERAQ